MGSLGKKRLRHGSGYGARRLGRYEATAKTLRRGEPQALKAFSRATLMGTRGTSMGPGKLRRYGAVEAAALRRYGATALRRYGAKTLRR